MKKSDNDLCQDSEKWNKEKIRQDICKSLRHGNIDYVFNQCELHYPKVLINFPRLLFRLRCQKFISMVKSIPFDQLDQSISTIFLTPTSSTSSPSPPATASTSSSTIGKKRLHEDMEKEIHDDNSNGLLTLDTCSPLKDLLEFGQFLYQQYGHISNKNNSNITEEGKKNGLEGIDVNHELISTTSFLAYTNINDNPISYLNGKKWRETMAYELNTAILVEEGVQPISALEKLYQQTTATINELVLNGNGKASIIPKLNNLF
ncbi:unnamed protein product [Cunninghamella echinulata]